jgi:transposase
MSDEELDDAAATVYEEFEDEAVRLALTSGRTQRAIAGDLGIGLSTLVRWVAAGRPTPTRCTSPPRHSE